MPSELLSRWSAAAGIALAFAAVSWIVYSFTSDRILLIFLLPIGLTLYNFGAPAAFFACLLAALLHPWQSLTSTALNALFFLLLTAVASRFLIANRRRQEQLRSLSALLPLCPNCGQLRCHDGQWRSLEQLLQNPQLPGALPSHSCSTPVDPHACP
jgi:hypothetical protein